MNKTVEEMFRELGYYKEYNTDKYSIDTIYRKPIDEYSVKNIHFEINKHTREISVMVYREIKGEYSDSPDEFSITEAKLIMKQIEELENKNFKCNCPKCGKELIGAESFIDRGVTIYKFYCRECDKDVYIINPSIVEIIEEK